MEVATIGAGQERIVEIRTSFAADLGCCGLATDVAQVEERPSVTIKTVRERFFHVCLGEPIDLAAVR